MRMGTLLVVTLVVPVVVVAMTVAVAVTLGWLRRVRLLGGNVALAVLVAADRALALAVAAL